MLSCCSSQDRIIAIADCNLSLDPSIATLTPLERQNLYRQVRQDFAYDNGDRPSQTLTDDAVCKILSSGVVSVVSSDDSPDQGKPYVHRGLGFEMLEEGLLYIKIDEFNASTEPELRNLMLSKVWKNSYKITIDLRANGGAAMKFVLPVVRLVSRPMEIIGSIKGSSNFTYRSNPEANRFVLSKPLVVLVDRNTSSGAEFFAAFIKNSRLGILVGENTAGLGVVKAQSVISETKLAYIPSAYMFDSKNVPIEGLGVSPNVAYSSSACAVGYKFGVCKKTIRKAFDKY